MDLAKTVDNRINELIEHDKSVNDALDMMNSSTVSLIEQYLTQFFDKYAENNQLTVTQANAMINSWDKQQFENLLENLDIANLSDDAQKRAKVLGVKAGINHGSMLNAMIGLSIIYMTDKQSNLIQSHEKQTILSQINHLTTINPQYQKLQNLVFAKIDNTTNKSIANIRKYLGIDKNKTLQPVKTTSRSTTPKNNQASPTKVETAVNNPDVVKIWSDNLWNKSDIMSNDIENMVNMHIRKGMSLEDLHDLLKSHNNKNQFNPNQSVADRVKQSEFNARRIIRTETSRMVNVVNKTTYQISGVEKVALHHEPDACDLCIDLSQQAPWDIDDAPSIPDDTHPNCYCYLIPIESEDSDDLITNPNDYNK